MDVSLLWSHSSLLSKICEVTTLLESDPHYSKEEAVKILKDVIDDMDCLYQRGLNANENITTRVVMATHSKSTDSLFMWGVTDAMSKMYKMKHEFSEGYTDELEEDMIYVQKYLESICK